MARPDGGRYIAMSEGGAKLPEEEGGAGRAEPAETSVRKRGAGLGRLVGHLVGGNMISMLIRLAGGVLQGRLVVPATLGLFSGFGLVLRYAPFFQLGILDGLYRELPYHVGKGERARAEELAAAAQAWALAVGGAFAAILFGMGIGRLMHGEYWMAAGWATTGVQSALFFYKTYYLQVTFRTSHDFSRLALVGVVESAASFALLALVAWLNFYGLCLRALLVGAIGTAALFAWRPLKVWPSWNPGSLLHLLQIGLPIFSVGQLYSLWSVLNATLVLKIMGTEGMGLYAVALMAYASIEFIPVAVRQVVYPRLAERYGKTHRIEGLVRMALKPSILTALGLVPLAGVAWHLAGPFVRLAMPAYEGAVPAMKWMLLLPVVNSFYPLASIFQVVRRQDLYAVAVGLGIAAYAVALAWLVRGGAVLTAFPQAMIVGQAVFAASCLGFVLWLQRRESRSEGIGKEQGGGR